MTHRGNQRNDKQHGDRDIIYKKTKADIKSAKINPSKGYLLAEIRIIIQQHPGKQCDRQCQRGQDSTDRDPIALSWKPLAKQDVDQKCC